MVVAEFHAALQGFLEEGNRLVQAALVFVDQKLSDGLGVATSAGFLGTCLFRFLLGSERLSFSGECHAGLLLGVQCKISAGRGAADQCQYYRR